VVEAGETEMETPVPTNVPPQLPEYHCQLAPVPNEPPTAVSVTVCPGQVGLALVVALLAATDAKL